MTKTSAELEREVEDARGRIDQTVEALKDKMQPRELFDEASRMMGGASNKMLSTAVEQLRENPIPIALIGAGVAWLALGQARQRREDAYKGYYETYEGYQGADYDPDFEGGSDRSGVRGAIREKASAAKHRLAETAEKAKSRLSDAREQAADGVANAKTRVGDLAHTAQSKAGEYTRVARERFDDTLETEPLVIAAIGVAVGAAIGAALPSTPVERRYIGPAREKAADAAKASLGEVKDVAQRAYAQVKDELHRQTGPEGEGSTLVEKAEALVGAGTQSVKSEVEGKLAH